MAKTRAKIKFVVELDSIEIEVPSQAEAQVLVKSLQAGIKKAVRKALSLPKEVKLTDVGFTGVLSGRIEGSDDAGFILDTFGASSEDENDSDNSEEQGVSAGGTDDKTPEDEAPESESEVEEPAVQTPARPKFGAKKPPTDSAE